MTLSLARIAALTLCLTMLPATAILLHFRVQEPIPEAPSWIPPPKVSMDAGDWKVRSTLEMVKQFGFESTSLLDECGNPRRPARIESYAITFIPSFPPRTHSDIVPTDDGVDITYREESARPSTPTDGHPSEALTPDTKISEYHFSAERSRQLQIAFANPEAWGPRTQPYSCIDCATSVLEACIRGHYSVGISTDANVAAEVSYLLRPESRKSALAK